MSTPDRRQKPRGTQFPSVYEGLSPEAAAIIREGGRRFDRQQHEARERARFERNLAAARRGLALNPTWGESVLALGAL